MQVQYLALSFSHKNTPIDLREKLAFPQSDFMQSVQNSFLQNNGDKSSNINKNPYKKGSIQDFLLTLKSKVPSLKEILLLSTCNRVEFYIITHSPEECITAVLDSFALSRKIPLKELEKHCKIAQNAEALHHLFSVVSGLDSVVIGETQIVGQIKSAYKLCYDLGVCGQEITRLAHFAFRCGGRVRSQTHIGKTPLSVASVAVKRALEFIHKTKKSTKTTESSNKLLAQNLTQNPQKLAKNLSQNPQISALIIGAGEMGKLVIRHLLDSRISIAFANRTLSNASNFLCELQEEGKDISNITLLDYKSLKSTLDDFTLVFCATGASRAIIKEAKSRDFKRAWFDLSVPRNIEVAKIPKDLHIFCVDDLKRTIDENLVGKKIQAHQAYAIIGNAVGEYFSWVQSFDVLPLIKTMRENAKIASFQELQRAIKKGYLPKELENEVKIILHNAFNVFLHNPTLMLKELANTQEGDSIIDATKRVFDEMPLSKKEARERAKTHNKNQTREEIESKANEFFGTNQNAKSKDLQKAKETKESTKSKRADFINRYKCEYDTTSTP